MTPARMLHGVYRFKALSVRGILAASHPPHTLQRTLWVAPSVQHMHEALASLDNRSSSL